MAQNSFTTPEEDMMIEREFRQLLDGYLASNHRKKVEIIERAFKFAREAHSGVRRRSGEPYIMHPIAVARIASREIGLGSTSICAALLHDVVEDTEYTVEDIRYHFGDKIAQLVDGLTKISGGIFGDKASAQAENFRKLLLTMSEDIRVVLIKMADRLHNMRTLGSMAPNKQYKIAGETLYIYAPLAHRLGLFAIKTELEDLAFKYEHPDTYARIQGQLSQSEEEREKVFRDFITPITGSLRDQGVRFSAKARVKSVYSIWNKMQTKGVPFEEVYDLYAVRIIFDCDDPAQEKAISWQIYSTITDIYNLHPERTRDWISAPKANGYQALHLTVMGPEGNWVEVQIRSRRMDEIAEKGFAAHWKYKSGESDEESELSAWLKTIRDILDNPEPNAIDFLDTLKLNLFASEIAVFTPKGEIITLPVNATVLDVAFHLHSQIGCHCIAGKVNHRLVPLSCRLKSGDQVEVLTSQSQTPKAEWLDFMVTARAKTRLRAALRKQQQPALAKGRRMLAAFMDANGIGDNNETVTKLLGMYHLDNRDQLCLRLASGEIVLGEHDAAVMRRTKESKGLLRKVFSIPSFLKGGNSSDPAPEPSDGFVKEDAPADAPVAIDMKATYELRRDASGTNFKLADCCHPIPGDEVLGFVDDDGQVVVHAIDCPRAMTLKAGYGQRLLSTRWAATTGQYEAHIRVEGIDRFGILQEIIQIISTTLAINIRSLDIAAEKEVFHCDLHVMVHDNAVAEELCGRLRQVKGVEHANRIH